MMREVDTLNRFGVAMNGAGQITLLMPPLQPMSKEHALVLAAYLVSLADPSDKQFQETLTAVRST